MKNNFDLPRYLRKHTHYILMFGYISALKKNLPSVTVAQAITQFCIYFNIDTESDDFNKDALLRMYERMNDDFFNSQKSK
jgi:hypothetical protein